MKRFNVESNLETVKDYKIEDLKYYNLYRNKKYILGHYNNFRNGNPVYYLEDELSREEKIILIDKFTNNGATYMLNIIDKFIEDYNNGIIKHKSYSIHKGSLKSWLNKNDKRKYISDYSQSYYAFGHEYQLNLNSKTANGSYDCYKNEDIVNDWFHGLLTELVSIERKYFVENDDREVKITELKKYRSGYLLDYIETEKDTEWERFGWSNCRDISDETLNGALEIYRKADEQITQLRNKYTEQLRNFIEQREGKRNEKR